jgi:MOSC domain-containing protein YiiM
MGIVLSSGVVKPGDAIRIEAPAAFRALEKV